MGFQEAEIKKLLGVKETEIRRAYKEFKITVPRSKRKYMIPYTEFRRRYLRRLLWEREKLRREEETREGRGSPLIPQARCEAGAPVFAVVH